MVSGVATRATGQMLTTKYAAQSQCLLSNTRYHPCVFLHRSDTEVPRMYSTGFFKIPGNLQPN